MPATTADSTHGRSSNLHGARTDVCYVNTVTLFMITVETGQDTVETDIDAQRSVPAYSLDKLLCEQCASIFQV